MTNHARYLSDVLSQCLALKISLRSIFHTILQQYEPTERQKTALGLSGNGLTKKSLWGKIIYNLLMTSLDQRLSDTLQMWYSLNELFARSVLKSDPDIRDTLWCPIYTYQKEKPAVWLHDGASKQ